MNVLPPWTLVDVGAEPMAVWAAALRDANPIHLDPAAAEALGFGPHTVNPGPANLAYVMNMLAAAQPDAVLVEIAARFLGNVPSGETVRATGSGADGQYEAQLVGMPGETPLLAVTATMTVVP